MKSIPDKPFSCFRPFSSGNEQNKRLALRISLQVTDKQCCLSVYVRRWNQTYLLYIPWSIDCLTCRFLVCQLAFVIWLFYILWNGRVND
jgi:hypothetical protein